MAARPLQPSEYEIQREVEALRDLRRRSTTPGALAIDPDLPNQSPPSSPTAQFWVGKSPVGSTANKDSSFINSPGEGSLSSDRLGAGSIRNVEAPNNPSDDPLHLFWVPASLHPEIAPAEFRAFLKEHARSPSDGSDTSALSTSPSSLSSSPSLSRKRSMLSRQYRPKENDGVEEENIVPLKRNRSLMYPTNPGPQLTISDLQKLEELAEEASESDDPSRLRNVLRRSLSMNISPSALDMMDEMPDMGDEADAPIIVPPPGQILRRAARTKIRKPGLPGDGGGHRFGSSRRGPTANNPPQPSPESRTSSEVSSSDHGESDTGPSVLRRQTMSDEGSQNVTRPESYSEEASIYDAYARDDEEDIPIPPAVVPAMPPAQLSPMTPQGPTPQPTEEPPRRPVDVIPIQHEVPPIIYQPQPQRHPAPQLSPDRISPARSPSPPPEHANERPTPVQQPPPFPTSAHSPPLQTRKDKDKKGLFGKWGSDKSSKKGQKEKERENRVASEKEKESGFFGSLFGKKKQDADYPSSMTGGTSGREAAQALLGASKSSKSYVPPTSPGLAPGIGGNPYARYPIHVERAIYRLSHIKLANPRRPLYEQVLISNLMFWYLGVINKAQNPSPSPTQPVANGASNPGASDNSEDREQEERERELREKEQREKEQREKAEKERLEREQREREREAELKKKESGRRGSLTKAPAGGQPGGRRAEMPIKGPQYEMQHRVMEQEYGGYNNPPRSPSAPIPVPNGGQPYSRVQQSQNSYSNSPPKMVQPQAKIQQEQYYYQPPVVENPHRPGLPPGAMAPADQSQWMSQSAPSPSSPNTQPQISPNANSHRRSRSPPLNPRQHQHQHPHPSKNSPMQLHKLNTSQESLGDRGHRSPSRSLSATAYTPPSPNGNVRKGNSAHAVISSGRRPHTAEGRSPNGEEEDVPLAVYQQQRRR